MQVRPPLHSPLLYVRSPPADLSSPAEPRALLHSAWHFGTVPALNSSSKLRKNYF